MPVLRFIRKWPLPGRRLALPSRIALLFGVGAISAAGAASNAATVETGQQPARVPQQSVKTFGELRIWSDDGRVYLSEAGGPFLGSDEVIFHVPVFPGDTLFASSKVLSRRLSGSRRGFGIVEWHTVGTNQNGAEVLSFRRSNLVPCRSTDTWQAREGS